eukprot:GHRQ01020513.1.p2 GENE.GHRQ01020513.1~~GHRQ01020513.1.p2  ORF type:complete len:103 (-),score=21.50 GHRQ01020513.1:797-1105(-)
MDSCAEQAQTMRMHQGVRLRATNTAAVPGDSTSATSYVGLHAAASPAREALLCGDTDTTTMVSGSPHLATNSLRDWCCSSTVSADVTQPLHARQSFRLTLIA